MGSKKNAHKRKSNNRLTKKRGQIRKNLRKKYRGGEGEINVLEPEVKPSGFMGRITDFWKWITGKKDVPSPTNGEIPEASPFAEPVEESPFVEPEEKTDETPEEKSEETPDETPEEKSDETPEEKSDETPEEKSDEKVAPLANPDEKSSPFENPTEETNENPFKKTGGRKKKTKQNRSTKKRRKQ